jgi:hypothetical protein
MHRADASLGRQCQYLPATCRSHRHVDGDMLEIDGIHMNPLVGETGLTVAIALRRKILDFGMAPRSNELPKTGFAVEIDGRIKAEFNTREGAENGAIELKRRFPALRIRLYDAETQSRHDVQA